MTTNKQYYNLYLKYKSKYIALKKQIGSGRLKTAIIRQGNIDGIDSLHIISYLQTLILSFPLVINEEVGIPETVKIANIAAELTTSRKDTKSKPWNYLIWRGLMLAGYDIGLDEVTINKYYDFGKYQQTMDDLALLLSQLPQWAEYAMNILLNFRVDPRKSDEMRKVNYESRQIIDLGKFFTGDKDRLNPILYEMYKD